MGKDKIGPRAAARIQREAEEEKQIKAIKKTPKPKSLTARIKGVFVESETEYNERKAFEAKKKKAELESYRKEAIKQARKAGAKKAKKGSMFKGFAKKIAKASSNAAGNVFSQPQARAAKRSATDPNYLTGVGDLFTQKAPKRRRAIMDEGVLFDVTGMRTQPKKRKKKSGKTGYGELDDIIFM